MLQALVFIRTRGCLVPRNGVAELVYCREYASPLNVLVTHILLVFFVSRLCPAFSFRLELFTPRNFTFDLLLFILSCSSLVHWSLALLSGARNYEGAALALVHWCD